MRIDTLISYQLISTHPYSWLFPRVAATVIHGGAGTVAASLRAGKPTIVIPFLGDQEFWGERVHALGAGPQPIRNTRLAAERLSAVIKEAVTDERMRANAADLGEQIRAENGVGQAVRAFNAYLARHTAQLAHFSGQVAVRPVYGASSSHAQKILLTNLKTHLIIKISKG